MSCRQFHSLGTRRHSQHLHGTGAAVPLWDNNLSEDETAEQSDVMSPGAPCRTPGPGYAAEWAAAVKHCQRRHLWHSGSRLRLLLAAAAATVVMRLCCQCRSAAWVPPPATGQK